MLIEQPRATTLHRGWKPLRIAGAILLAAIVAGVVLLATHWPFTQKAVIQALQEASGRQVRIRTFSNSYFPPGCVAEGVSFLRHKHPDLPPIISVNRLVIQGSFIGFLQTPTRLRAVRVVGMHMIVPPNSGESQGRVPLNSGAKGKSLAISEITADGAVLEFVRQDGKKPYILRIDKLEVTDVGAGKPVVYHSTLTNTEPPGVIRAEGKFGPWNPADVGATAVSGVYTYDDIDLSVFQSVAGKGHARGQFYGPLSRIQTRGEVDVAGFRVDGSEHTVQLHTTFDATVNGTNGDVQMHPAVAHYRRTEVEVSGWIAGQPDEPGKTASFGLSLPRARVEDLLYLFTKSEPGMAGNVQATGKFVWPPGPRGFLEKIGLDLSFGMSGSRFTNPDTQNSIDAISESAQGENKKEHQADLRTVLANLQGNIRVRSGIAVISNARFEVPGAEATVQGTYNLLEKRMDLHGVLDTRGHLSDTASGFKALVLKAMTPLFRKRSGVRMIPFRITGAYGATSVGIDWKKDLPQPSK